MSAPVASLLTIFTVAAILFATALVLRWIREDHTPDETDRAIGIGGAADREGR
jgi:hypothetical protein